MALIALGLPSAREVSTARIRRGAHRRSRLRMIAPLFLPEVAALSFWPQMADHLIWGPGPGWVPKQLARSRLQRMTDPFCSSRWRLLLVVTTVSHAPGLNCQACPRTVRWAYDHPHRADREHPTTAAADRGDCGTRRRRRPALDALYEEAIRDTIERFEATGSPVITDGEQRKYHNFWTYCVHGLPNTAPGRFQDPVCRRSHPPDAAADGRPVPLPAARRQLPGRGAALRPRPGEAGGHLALGVESDVPRRRDSRLLRATQFIHDLLHEHETEVRSCLRKGAHKVQIDFTEGRLAVKIDPSGSLLHSFIDLNNLALARFSAEERQRIGVHTCPGGDRDSTHSADVDYSELVAQPVRAEGRQLLRRAGGRGGSCRAC